MVILNLSVLHGNGHLNSVVPVKNQSSQAPLSLASANLDCDMDSDNLAKDQSYILNIENKETDLPLYEFGINVGNVVYAIKALLDTGASANYISPHLVNDNMKVISLRQARQVETAGGHIIDIKHKVEFSLVAQGLEYKVQAYVFEMKFDVILGQQWFRDARPIPDWGNCTWLLPARRLGLSDFKETSATYH
ncbi:hypothetical protein G6F43_014033 [Rhizopus delemar]|nr:hypothetical protein G6F43_014033 [Rhizopus delemar]